MNKAELKKFAVEARRDLLEKVSLKAEQYGITKDNVEFKIEENYGQLFVNEQPYLIERKHAFQTLQQRLSIVGYEQLVEEVAYTWFNRIIAIRYMEVNNYLPDRVNVLSSSTGKNEPDILLQYETMNLDVDYKQINEWIQKGENEQPYRKLFVAQCNNLFNIFPSLFQKINDFTELLLPDYLLDSESIISYLVNNEELTKCFYEVEVIGWLYQFYNSEPKDEVFTNLKKNRKVRKSDIPAATQIFTPKWIVKYMVENSLGNIWMESNGELNNETGLDYLMSTKDQVDLEQHFNDIKYKNIVLEDIKIIDPCVGSGHILIYAFDLLFQMYKDAGYPTSEIAELILNNNIYGLDVDDRATQLACFAIMMKAREKSRRILRKNVKPNIISFQESNGMDIEGISNILCSNDEEKKQIYTLIDCFYDAKNYGSILDLPKLNFDEYLRRIDNMGEIQTTLNNYQAYSELGRLKTLLKQAIILTSEYDVTITNPPYMGQNGMNKELSNYIKNYYKDSKGDLSTVFMEVCLRLTKKSGFMSLINIPSWMFLGSYENLRKKLILNTTFYSLIHLGRGIFGSDFGTTSFVLRNTFIEGYTGTYKRLFENYSSVDSLDKKEKKFFEKPSFYISQLEFLKIDGAPITYWAKDIDLQIFSENQKIEDVAEPKQGLASADNTRFLRLWFEPQIGRVGFKHTNRSNAKQSKAKWFPYNKGGKFQKWYGNIEYVINWENDGEELRNFNKSVIRSPQYYFKKSLTWSKVTIGGFSVRYIPEGFLFDVAGCSIFFNEDNEKHILYYMGLLNSKVIKRILEFISPTVNYEVSHIAKIPIKKMEGLEYEDIVKCVTECIKITKNDWDSFETSWDFTKHPFLKFQQYNRLSDIFALWLEDNKQKFERLKSNEEKMNEIFIKYYNLQNELSPNVTDKEVTISMTDKERDSKTFLSYFISCVMGRYSLDVEGLAYAGGEFDETKYQTFKPNQDGLIQITDDYYFDNDIIVRLREFLSVSFSPDSVNENMQWLAESLTMKKNESPEERLRRYFIDEFFNDHCKTYQKRPIYWLVDSGKQKGLRTLIYMHRYQPDTMATIRFEHLQEIQSKYQNEIDMIDTRLANPSLSPADKRNLEKLKTAYQKKIEELQEFDKKLATYANEQIDIDLDDGVKVNYAKFNEVLTKIK